MWNIIWSLIFEKKSSELQSHKFFAHLKFFSSKGLNKPTLGVLLFGFSLLTLAKVGKTNSEKTLFENRNCLWHNFVIRVIFLKLFSFHQELKKILNIAEQKPAKVERNAQNVNCRFVAADLKKKF